MAFYMKFSIYTIIWALPNVFHPKWHFLEFRVEFWGDFVKFLTR